MTGPSRLFQTQRESSDAGVTHTDDADARGRVVAHTFYERVLGIKSGRGAAVVEFDVARSSVYQVDNGRTGVREWVSDGALYFSKG